MPVDSFLIRVYGILLDERKGILISDEFEYGQRFSKFPGGGLELGEGIEDCLHREWKEELGQTIAIVRHYYTTGFFQVSAFNPRQQLISVYYLVKTLDEPVVKISATPFDFAGEKEGSQSFRWVALKDFSPNVVTFPVDKVVAEMICEGWK